MGWKQFIKAKGRGSVLFVPFRDFYQMIFNRSRWKSRKGMHRFYSQFVGPGDLVFDVGANVGDYTEMFARLGARVLAIEANPELIATLSKIRPRRRIRVEAVAVGSSDGWADLFVCGQDQLGTLSKEWIDVAEKSERLSGFKWKSSGRVRVTTLDSLIDRHGLPDFIKVDVEGFESEVLEGLRSLPKVLSFEFNAENALAAEVCLHKRCIPEDAKFNLIIQLNMRFEFPSWITREELINYLRSPAIKDSATWGDIFVRREN
ncbi:MAG: hypothetical protein C5B47_04580 [Verrucomicrobia bacterium]|nr:MAG: hypothetical protein C5B47_04580 [Verrucomicrobiota bacterium]